MAISPIFIPLPISYPRGVSGTPEQVGLALLGIAGFIIWFMLCIWLSEKQSYIDEIVFVITTGVLLPLLTIGLILIN